MDLDRTSLEFERGDWSSMGSGESAAESDRIECNRVSHLFSNAGVYSDFGYACIQSNA